MQPELERIVRQWLEKARRNLALARLAAEADPPLLDGAVYHCQQSAEKALKGFLTWHARPFPPTRDLRDLIQLCLGAAGDFARIDVQGLRSDCLPNDSAKKSDRKDATNPFWPRSPMTIGAFVRNRDTDPLRKPVHADTLFPYAVAFRYPGVALEPGRDEAEEALQLAEEVYAFGLQRLPAALHP